MKAYLKIYHRQLRMRKYEREFERFAYRMRLFNIYLTKKV